MTRTSTTAAFNRALLKDIQREAKRRWPKLDMRSALRAGRARKVGAVAAGDYYVEGVVNGKRITWYGRAEDAAHAKYQVWKKLLG